MEWEFRRHILILFHRWYLILLIFGSGAVLGWGVSLVLPSSYRAETDLGVYYQSDAIFRNVDDYKNWEMEQLQAAIFSDALLGKTQQELALKDNYWKDKPISAIRSMLHVYWRNAGVWHLVAQASKPNYAHQLVETWKAVILNEIGAALAKSDQWLRLNTELQVASRAKLELQARQALLAQIQQVITKWLASDEAQQKNPLSPRIYWQFYDIAARLAEDNSAGRELLSQLPPPNSPAMEFAKWMEKALGVLSEEQTLVQSQIPSLEEKIKQDTQQLTEWANTSWGLSAYIHLDTLNPEIKPARTTRSSPLFAFVGGILALLGSATVWLALIERQAKG